MSIISPNPDTPLIDAYGYTFKPRPRQPGGRALKTCLPASLAVPGIATPNCQCAVFNNWGMPDGLLVHFAGFTEYANVFGYDGTPCCSSQCGYLNDAIATYQGNGNGGKGPWPVAWGGDSAAYFDDATQTWIGGGLEHIPGSLTEPHSGVGYSCDFDGPTTLYDPCNGGNVRIGVQIGYDTLAGVFAQVNLGGYYVWTWTHLCPAGTLDCSGNGALNLLNLTRQKQPILWEFEADPGQCGYQGLDQNGNPVGTVNSHFLCHACKGDGNIADNGTGASQGTVGCVLDCGDGGTNEVAPPCCCGSDTPPQYGCRCLFLCLGNTDPNAYCSAAFPICLQDASNPTTWYGLGYLSSDGSPVTASLAFDKDTGKWTLTSSCLEAPITVPKFPSRENSPWSPPDNPSAGACCASGDWKITLSCFPVPCPGFNPHFEPCCTGDLPAEIKITIPPLPQGAAGTPPNPCECAKYAGEYWLSLTGLQNGSAVYEIVFAGHCKCCGWQQSCFGTQTGQDSIICTVSCRAGFIDATVTLSTRWQNNPGSGGYASFVWAGSIPLPDSGACCGATGGLPYNVNAAAYGNCLLSYTPCNQFDPSIGACQLDMTLCEAT